MPREVQYIAPTERKKINRKEAVKIFLAHNGRCCNCTRQINADTEDWFIEHPEALILGGSDGSDNRRPAHVECKAHKDAADATARSERDAAIARNWQRDDGAPRQSGFRKAAPQRRASSPPIPKFEGDIMAFRGAGNDKR